jgi:predicted RNase H-like HicB family nuclease
MLYSAVAVFPRNEAAMTNVDAKRQVTVLFARDPDGHYAATVRGLRRGGQAHGQTLEQVMARIREAVELCLAADPPQSTSSVPGLVGAGTQHLEFPA